MKGRFQTGRVSCLHNGIVRSASLAERFCWLGEWCVAKGLAATVGTCFAICGAALAAEQPAVLRVGTARTDITPTKPVTLAGYESRKDLSQGVHDPLSARAVAFEQDGKRLVLVSTDSLGFYGGTAASYRKAILAACGLQPSELFLAAIHTHSAPTLTTDRDKGHPNNIEYTQTLETRLVDVVREALAHTAPAQIGVGSGSSPVGVNRREVVRDAAGNSQLRLGRNPSVPTDREVQVLKVSRAGTGDLVAVVFAYATHSTSLGPRNYIVSGDVHGLAAQFLEKHLGGGVMAPAFAGASGDIDPWYRVLPEFNTRGGWIPEPVLMGTMLGEEVVHVLNGIRKPGANGPVKTAFQTLLLPGKPPADPGAAAGAAVEFNLTVGRVGDVALVGLGGEVFNEIGKAIKAASPLPYTFVITHCNGAAGYLPTQPSYDEGGYEVKSTPFAPTAAEQVVREVTRMLREL
ncbi:MAG: neutral/alkaline non-lysosomal ceramidase N-terminal domain-containing protein [Planctomycetes bacterium]|nr:neutral/alkaline non-lysosomal ceramidase N-terminal domain-containing protein [Planctomycetota bacterium]